MFLKTSSYWEHCWCCTGFDDAARSRERLAVAGVVVVPGSAECRVTDAEAEPGELSAAVMDNDPVQDSE